MYQLPNPAHWPSLNNMNGQSSSTLLIIKNKWISKSVRKIPCHPNVIEGPFKTILLHCLPACPEPIAVNRGRVRFDLVHEELTKPLLKLRFGASLRPSRRGWCPVAAQFWIELRLQPHVGHHLADAFFHILAESPKTFSIGDEYVTPKLLYRNSIWW